MDLEPLSGPAVYAFPNHGLTARLRLCRLAAFLLLAPSILPGVEARVRLEVVRRDVLISNPGTYKIPDEQLHYPYLYESTNGRWYLTYREGPHREAQWGPGNREQCVQSGDRGKTWLPWMGMRPELLYQFFVTRLRDGSLVSYRHKMTGLARSEDGTIQGTQFILRSKDEGAAWSRHLVPVTNLPFTLGSVLVSFWGPALEMPDGRLLWPVYSREGGTRYPYGVALGSILGITESTDGGSSFRWIASMCDDVTVGQHREPGLVRLPSGELLAVIRTGTFPSDDKVMVQVRSSDGGYTWSPPRCLSPGPAVGQWRPGLQLRFAPLPPRYGKLGWRGERLVRTADPLRGTDFRLQQRADTGTRSLSDRLSGGHVRRLPGRRQSHCSRRDKGDSGERL